MRRPGAHGVILLLTLLSGCDAAGSRPAPAPTPPPSQSAAAEHTCAAKLAGNEIQGHGSPDTDLWGLLFSSYPLPRAEQVKIVWRMTGSGELTLLASGPMLSRSDPRGDPSLTAAATGRSQAPSGARALCSRLRVAGRSTPTAAATQPKPTYKSQAASRAYRGCRPVA